MSWTDHHRRHHTMDGVLAEVARTGRPWIPASWDPAVATEFGGQAQFLAALHYRWLLALTARLDDPAADPREVQVALAGQRPALYAMLAAHADHPALTSAAEVERRRCGTAHGPAWATRRGRSRRFATAS